MIYEISVNTCILAGCLRESKTNGRYCSATLDDCWVQRTSYATAFTLKIKVTAFNY